MKTFQSNIAMIRYIFKTGIHNHLFLASQIARIVFSERPNPHCVTSKFENLVLSETQLGDQKNDECRERIKSHQDMISNFLLKGHGLIRNYLFQTFAKVDFSF